MLTNHTEIQEALIFFFHASRYLYLAYLYLGWNANAGSGWVHIDRQMAVIPCLLLCSCLFLYTCSRLYLTYLPPLLLSYTIEKHPPYLMMTNKNACIIERRNHWNELFLFYFYFILNRSMFRGGWIRLGGSLVFSFQLAFFPSNFLSVPWRKKISYIRLNIILLAFSVYPPSWCFLCI